MLDGRNARNFLTGPIHAVSRLFLNLCVFDLLLLAFLGDYPKKRGFCEGSKNAEVLLELSGETLQEQTSRLHIAVSHGLADGFSGMPLLQDAASGSVGCPQMPLLRALWSLLDGSWGSLKGSWECWLFRLVGFCSGFSFAASSFWPSSARLATEIESRS